MKARRIKREYLGLVHGVPEHARGTIEGPIGRDPHNRNVVIACGFSGHGFKFVPVIGEIVTRILLDEDPQFDIGFLRLERLSGT